jgi:hypothetical protein
MLGKLLGLVLGAVFVGALAPTAVTAIMDANTTGWDAAPLALWGIVAICVVAGFIILILKEAGVEF